VKLSARCALALALSLLLLAGCVERRLFLKSDPPGAEVSVNGQPVGLAPVSVPFVTYGYYEIVMSAPGHHRLSRVVEVSPPWWQYVPFDFFVEMIWPFTVTDERQIAFSLEPFSRADEAAVVEREEQMRRWLDSGERPQPSSSGSPAPVER